MQTDLIVWGAMGVFALFIFFKMKKLFSKNKRKRREDEPKIHSKQYWKDALNQLKEPEKRKEIIKTVIKNIPQPPPEKEITFPDAEISFALETDDFKQVVNAANTLGLPEIVVEGDSAEIRLVVSDTGNVSSDIFSIKVGETDKTFRMVFKTENLTKVMEGSYDIELSSKRISHFKRKSDSLEYWIALEQNSTYEE